MGYIGNAPYQGVLTGGNIQDGTVETTDLANGAVTTVKLGDGQVTAGKLAATLDLTGKTVTLPAGVGGHASGTEANRPAAPAIGTIYFNTDEDTLQQYTSAGWENIGLIPPAISSVSGTIYNTFATNLTISGGGFGVGATVRFSYGGSTSDVLVAPDSNTQITVAVPSAVYNQASGTSVTISVIASGLASNGSSKTVQAMPTGGTITTSGSYRIHTFLSSSTLTVPNGFSATAEYLVVAGGGGGGGAGGGGAGGLLASSATLNATQSITVGIGGPGAPQGIGTQGSDGLPSSFGSIASTTGGGGGGAYNSSTSSSSNGRPGGSGGGGGWPAASGGSGTFGQGFAGGTSVDSSAGPYGSAGGGGAGAVGASGSDTTGGNGGIGILSAINGTAYYWGGGGGGGGGGAQASGSVSGNGGNGGGGGGANWVGGTAGTGGAGLNAGTNGQQASDGTSLTGGAGGANTGGGGGGMGISVHFGGAGGSGIVIVRYQLT